MEPQKGEGAADRGGSFFSVQYEFSKDGQEIVCINGRAVHSRVHPDRECEGVEFPDKSLIAIFGMGAGYHIKNIAQAHPDAMIIVYEPLFELYQDRERFCRQFTENEHLVIVNTLDFTLLFSLISRALSHSFLRFVTYANTAYHSLFPDPEKQFFTLIKKAYELHLQNMMTESHFIPLWYKNTINNIAKLYGIPVMDFPDSDERKEQLAVVCGAGPSLNRHFELIKRERERFTLFAADTALLPLLSHGITPDLVVSLDGQHYSLYDFVGELPENMYFAFDILAYPDLPQRYKNSLFTFTEQRDDSLAGFFCQKLRITPSPVKTGGTVSDYALDIAVQCGFKTIFLAGYDLSFPGLVTHCAESPYHRRTLALSGYLTPQDTMMIGSIAVRSPVCETAFNGKSVFTDFVMNNYRAYLETYIEAHPSIRFYMDAPESISVAGVRSCSFKALLLGTQKKTAFVPQKKVIGDKTEMYSIFDALLNDLYRYAGEIAPKLEKADWSRFDALAESLTATLHALFTTYPFMRKFAIMTEVILDKKGILPDNPLFVKHLSFRVLQSLYYMIRTLQKAVKKSF